MDDVRKCSEVVVWKTCKKISKSCLFQIHPRLSERQRFRCNGTKDRFSQNLLPLIVNYCLLNHAFCRTLFFIYFFALLQDEKFDEAQGPSMSDLVLAEDVDILPYIAWQQYPGVDKKQDLVRDASFPVPLMIINNK